MTAFTVWMSYVNTLLVNASLSRGVWSPLLQLWTGGIATALHAT